MAPAELTDLVCGTCGLTTNALPCPHCSHRPTTDLAELTVRDNSGQVVHERLCLCADCENKHRVEVEIMRADGRLILADMPLDHSPDNACVCDVCEPRI